MKEYICDIEDVVHLSIICKSLHQQLQDEDIWKLLHEEYTKNVWYWAIPAYYLWEEFEMVTESITPQDCLDSMDPQEKLRYKELSTKPWKERVACQYRPNLIAKLGLTDKLFIRVTFRGCFHHSVREFTVTRIRNVSTSFVT